MLRRMSLKSKLLSAFGLTALALLAVGLIAFKGLRSTIAAYEHVSAVNVEALTAIFLMELAQKDLVIAAGNVTGFHNLSNKSIEFTNAILTKAVEQFEANEKGYLSLPQTTTEQELWKAARQHWDPLLKMTKEMIDLSRGGNIADEQKRDQLAAGPYLELRVAIRKALTALHSYQLDEKKVWVSSAQSTAHSTISLLTVIVVCSTAASFLFGLLLASALTKRLRDVAALLARGSEQVASASQQVSASSSQLSGAASEQAATLEQTASSIEEMNSMVTKSSETAKSASTTSSDSQSRAEEGQNAVNQMIQSMDEIKQSNQSIMRQVDASNSQMSEIVNLIQEIGSKTKVINDIVFQTKLLSFNASVEAARAGEHGKGFAVVAEEVGSLAQMSGNAAKEITSLLDESVKKVQTIVAQTRSQVSQYISEGQRKIENGSEVASQCGKVLADIVTNVAGVANMAAEISTASEEQALGVQEITKAMNQLDQVTQQNAATTSQIASAAEELSAQAEHMREAASNLMNLVEGDGNLNSTVIQTPKPYAPNNIVEFRAKRTAEPKKAMKMKMPQSATADIARSTSTAETGLVGAPSLDHPGFQDT